MQAGAQATQRFDRQVRRIGRGQQVRAHGLGALALDVALQYLLILTERHGGIDRQAQLLDDFGILDAAVQCMTQQGNSYAQHAAQQGGQHHDQRLLRFDRLGGIDNRIVDDAYITHGTRTYDVQLLRGVQHCGVNFSAHFDVTCQAQQLLLRLGQATNAVNQIIAALFQLRALIHQGAIVGVLAGKAAFHFRAFEFQLGDRGLQLDHPIQYGLGFEGNVD